MILAYLTELPYNIIQNEQEIIEIVPIVNTGGMIQSKLQQITSQPV